MAVSARTFQALYIVRQRAVNDLPTVFDDFGAFIAARRKDAPDIYHKAYMNPSALGPLLHRMTTGDNVLTLTSGLYDFTPMGSQMADLLVDIDACGSRFIENYKEEIALAVLQQRQRIGQGPVTPRETASIANISLDSARRGLSTLVAKGLCEENRDGRTPVYELTTPEASVEDKKRIDADIEKAARIPLNDGDDNDPNFEGFTQALNIAMSGKIDPEVSNILDGIDEDDSNWVGDPPPPVDDDDNDLLALPLGKILGDDEPERVGPFQFKSKHEELLRSPHDWNAVTDQVQASLITQAQACGMDLNEFMDTLARANKMRMAKALHVTVQLG